MKALLQSELQVKNLENIKKVVVLSDTHIPVRAAKMPEKIKIGTSLRVKYLHHGESESRTTYLAFEPDLTS